MQKLYNTPEKRAARPWGQYANWAVIAAIYVLTFLAVYHRQILFAKVPGPEIAPHTPADWEQAVVIGGNFALAIAMWILVRRYVESRVVQQPVAAERVPVGGR
jgi:hypothetical protein